MRPPIWDLFLSISCTFYLKTGCAPPPFATKQRPPIWKILDPPLYFLNFHAELRKSLDPPLRKTYILLKIVKKRKYVCDMPLWNVKWKKIWNASRICVSSLRRGHANLLCIVPILVYVLPKLISLCGALTPLNTNPGWFYSVSGVSHLCVRCRLIDYLFQNDLVKEKDFSLNYIFY